jgi:hypothetical protein
MLTFFLSGDVARTLDVSPTRVKQLVARGLIRARAKTIRGVGLYDPLDVEALRLERAARRARKTIER